MRNLAWIRIINEVVVEWAGIFWIPAFVRNDGRERFEFRVLRQPL